MTKPWWKDGIKFECQGSGKCCVSRGQYGYVYVTLQDRQRFAKFFGISTPKLYSKLLPKNKRDLELERL